MDYSSPPRRRKPQVEPARDVPPSPSLIPDESAPPGTTRDRSSPLRDPFAREQDAAQTASVGKRRRDRKARKTAVVTAAAVPRDQTRQVFISWRWFSAAIVLAMGLTLYVLLTNDAFYVNSIAVGNRGETRYLSAEEIFERSGLAKIHLFWIDAGEVAARLEQDAQIADAEVVIGWPPNLAQITITERQPALVWIQSGQKVWVDVRGRVMALRQDLPALVQVIVDKPTKDIHPTRCEYQGTDRLLGVGTCIDQDTVNGVLQFKALYPDVAEMVYDPIKGLGFRDGRNWLLWIGKGTDIQTKMVVYNSIVADATAKNRQPVEISVIDPDRPYYSWTEK